MQNNLRSKKEIERIVKDYDVEYLQIEKLDNLIWKIAHNTWYTRAKKYIKEKNNISYEETNEIPKIYIIQLIFNLLWSFVFFKFNSILE